MILILCIKKPQGSVEASQGAKKKTVNNCRAVLVLIRLFGFDWSKYTADQSGVKIILKSFLTAITGKLAPVFPVISDRSTLQPLGISDNSPGFYCHPLIFSQQLFFLCTNGKCSKWPPRFKVCLNCMTVNCRRSCKRRFRTRIYVSENITRPKYSSKFRTVKTAILRSAL